MPEVLNTLKLNIDSGRTFADLLKSGNYDRVHPVLEAFIYSTGSVGGEDGVKDVWLLGFSVLSPQEIIAEMKKAKYRFALADLLFLGETHPEYGWQLEISEIVAFELPKELQKILRSDPGMCTELPEELGLKLEEELEQKRKKLIKTKFKKWVVILRCQNGKRELDLIEVDNIRPGRSVFPTIASPNVIE